MSVRQIRLSMHVLYACSCVFFYRQTSRDRSEKAKSTSYSPMSEPYASQVTYLYSFCVCVYFSHITSFAHTNAQKDVFAHLCVTHATVCTCACGCAQEHQFARMNPCRRVCVVFGYLFCSSCTTPIPTLNSNRTAFHPPLPVHPHADAEPVLVICSIAGMTVL